MRKFCLSILAVSIILLMVSLSIAQSPRQPTSSEGKTTFTNIAVTGLDATGVPGYIELMSTDGSTRYYLYVNSSAVLMIASEISVGLDASPQTVTWITGRTGHYGEVGVPVSRQWSR